MIERNFNLHLTAGHSTALVINVNQFDQGEKWIFTLYNENGTQYIPSTGAIVGIKSDGLGIINSGSVVDGKVVIMETEQMTAAVGKAVFELMIDSQTHGTANFIVLVEPKPGNNADLSESDLSLLQEAIDATSPLPTGGSVGQVLTKTASGSAWSDAGTPTQEQVADAVSDWADEHITVSTGVVIDTSLSVAGAAADSKKVGDEIADLKSAINAKGSLTESQKGLIIQILRNALYSTDQSDNIDELEQSFNKPVSSITATLNLGSDHIYSDDSLDVLRQYLTVVATFEDATTEAVTAYQLSGTLTVGTSVITVTYGGKTTTVSVPVNTPVTKYAITNNLTNVVNSNSATTIAEGNTYTAVLTGSADNFEINSVIVTLGGTNVTATAWDDETGTVTIANVNGAIVITASAVRVYKPVSNGLLYNFDFRSTAMTPANVPGWGNNTNTFRDEADTVYLFGATSKDATEHGFSAPNWRGMREISNGTLTNINVTLDSPFTLSCLFWNTLQPNLGGLITANNANSVILTPKYLNGNSEVTNGSNVSVGFEKIAEGYTLVTYRADGNSFKVWYNDSLLFDLDGTDYDGFVSWYSTSMIASVIYNSGYVMQTLIYNRALTDAELLANKDYFDSIQ